MPSLAPLPIDDAIPQLLAALCSAPAVVLRAPPGAGKTTRVPPAILDGGIAGSGKILMLEPRRIAARAAARRIAFERGSRVGEEIGFRVRFESQATRATRIEAITEGILLRRLQDDPMLEDVGAVIFDEFHERRLDSDLALAMVRRVQESVRPDLKIVVMSATFEVEPISRFLGDAPIVESLGRMYPVAIEYAALAMGRGMLGDSIADAVGRILSRTSGDVLVFLPGVGEIRQAKKSLDSLGDAQLAIMELYGDLPSEAQDAVLAPAPRGKRKVVLATNVAETSITIDGVTTVIDSGLARVLRFDPHVGLDRLEVEPISQASADQRAGRAGRTAPGICLRLWNESAQRARAAMEEPEIRRVDLAGPALQLMAWGESDLAAFPWFEAPREESRRQALELLERLGATEDGLATSMGQTMAKLPVHPRLARLLLAGQEFGQSESVALAAALLAERDPFPRERDAGGRIRAAAHVSESDVVDAIHALEAFAADERDTRAARLDRGAVRAIFRARDQLLRQLRGEIGSQPSTEIDADEAIQRALLAAFPDRLARRRERGSKRGVLVGGRGVTLAPSSAVQEAELFVCVDVDGAGAEALVRKASAVERSWLPEDRLRTVIETEFDETEERVQARRRVFWDTLLLEESPAAIPKSDQAAQTLAAAAALHLDRVLPESGSAAYSFLTRARSLRIWMPDLGLPDFDENHLRQILPDVCRGRRSFAELRSGPWLDHLRSGLSWQQLSTIDREAPERIEVPSGSHIALEYTPGKPPVLAVRIQEMFGCPDTPRIAGGRVKVLLHLLAPNYRPQQVTDDLASFWRTTYAVVRKELRARYPKHSWPDDPLNAEAMRGAKRRRPE